MFLKKIKTHLVKFDREDGERFDGANWWDLKWVVKTNLIAPFWPVLMSRHQIQIYFFKNIFLYLFF
jgi:hypothetical protein